VCYKHLVVEHKTSFAVDHVDPITGERHRWHTNRIEGAWKHAKQYFRIMNGTSVGNFEAHLCEIMFRNRERTNSLVATLQLICKHYPLITPPMTSGDTRVFKSWLADGTSGIADTIDRGDSSCTGDSSNDCADEDETQLYDYRDSDATIG
jgi:hypothetical protein